VDAAFISLKDQKFTKVKKEKLLAYAK